MSTSSLPAEAATTASSLSLRGRVRTVRIADCVHYCAFAYGRGHFNPYQDYITGLAKGVPIEQLRERFIDFIRHYRPRDLGEALGVKTQASVPLWLLPWKTWRKLLQADGWRDSPDDCVDLLTYFSPQGLRASRFLDEWGWLEGAWRNISANGYRPEAHSYIHVFELRGERESRYVVTDGNHRLSALAALGVEEVRVLQPWFSTARRACARAWPLVLSGHVGAGDARRIFDAYFCGNRSPHRAAQPAELLPDLAA